MKKGIIGMMMVVMTTALLGTSLVSCGDDNEDEVLFTAEMTDDGHFAAVGGTRNIRVKSNTEWVVTTQVIEGTSDWLTTDISQGKDERTIGVTASSNTSLSTRKAIVKVSCTTDASKTREFTFTQDAPEPTLKVSASSVKLKALDRKPASVKIESNVAWTVACSESWLSIDKESGVGNQSISLTADNNPSDTERTATVIVTVKDTELAQTITVTQASTADLLYREPYTTWKSSVTDVKSYMSGYSVYSETATQIFYEGKYKERLTAYLFDSDKLTGAVVAISSSTVTSSDIENSLKDNGYNANGTDKKSRKKFVSSDKKTIVLIDLNTENAVYYIYYYDEEQYNKLFEEPYTSWGASRSAVNSVMTIRGYTLTDESTNASDSYYMMYKGKDWEICTLYYFDTSIHLKQAAVVFDESVVGENDVDNYLRKKMGCTYVTAIDEYTYYYTSDKKSAIAVYNYYNESLQALLVYLVYFDASAGARAGRDMQRDAIPFSDFTPQLEQIRETVDKWVQNKGNQKNEL